MIDIVTIIFFVALLGIVGMIFFKHRELTHSKSSPLSKLGENADEHIHGVYNKIKYFISHLNRRTAIAVVQWVAFHVLTWLRNIYIWLRNKAHSHPHAKKVIDMVSGRGDAHKNGGSSFYLKHIAAGIPKDHKALHMNMHRGVEAKPAVATAAVNASSVVSAMTEPVSSVENAEIVAENPEK
jgi:hypothetical protein